MSKMVDKVEVKEGEFTIANKWSLEYENIVGSLKRNCSFILGDPPREKHVGKIWEEKDELKSLYSCDGALVVVTQTELPNDYSRLKVQRFGK